MKQDHWSLTITREQRSAWVRLGFKDPVSAYRAHENRAKARGIEFKLSFAQWWGLWEQHWHMRGKGIGKKCMCRSRDAGAYEIGNVRIDTNRGNADEMFRLRRERRVLTVQLTLVL